MRSFLAVVMVLCMASFVLAQPPLRGPNKFGMGKIDPAKMMEMRHRMMQRKQLEDKPDFQRRPGPPPWAGKGMRRGHRGPQHPFLGKGRSTKGQERPDVRRSRGKTKVSGHHRGHRGRGWQHHGKKPEIKGRSFKKQDHRRYTKKRGCKSCACKDCPNNK